MSTLTQNYDFIKDDPGEKYSIQKINENLDMIDATLKEIADNKEDKINTPLPISKGGHGGKTAAQALANLGAAPASDLTTLKRTNIAFYVDNVSGSDTNDGSLTKPLKTVAPIANLAPHAETIQIRFISNYTGDITLFSIGSSRMLFEAYDKKGNAVTSGITIFGRVYLGSYSYISIKNLVFDMENDTVVNGKVLNIANCGGGDITNVTIKCNATAKHYGVYAVGGSISVSATVNNAYHAIRANTNGRIMVSSASTGSGNTYAYYAELNGEIYVHPSATVGYTTAQTANGNGGRIIIGDTETNGVVNVKHNTTYKGKLNVEGAFTASGGITGNVTGNVTGTAAKATDSDTLDGYHAAGFDRLGVTTDIQNGADLNTYTTPGNYAAKTDAIAASTTNRPTKASIKYNLTVRHSYGAANGATTYNHQVLTMHNGGGSFERFCVGGTWTAWGRLGDGCNADTLDGSHASDFASAIDVARLNYTSITVYVSPAGSDNNAGLSASTPFKTIGKALTSYQGCNAIMVSLADGSYTLSTVGTARDRLSICGASKDASKVMITGKIQVTGVAYAYISHVTVDDSAATAGENCIWFDGSSGIIDNCIVKGNTSYVSGVLVSQGNLRCSTVKVDNCKYAFNSSSTSIMEVRNNCSGAGNVYVVSTSYGAYAYLQSGHTVGYTTAETYGGFINKSGKMVMSSYSTLDGSGIPVMNGTMQTKLNADMLDGLHSTDFVTVTNFRKMIQGGGDANYAALQMTNSAGALKRLQLSNDDTVKVYTSTNNGSSWSAAYIGHVANADTVDNLHASAFAQISGIVNNLTSTNSALPLSAAMGKSLSDKISLINGTKVATDANALVNTGQKTCYQYNSSTLNTPYKAGLTSTLTAGFIETYYSSADFGFQTAYAIGTTSSGAPLMFIRSYNTGTWTNWVKK